MAFWKRKKKLHKPETVASSTLSGVPEAVPSGVDPTALVQPLQQKERGGGIGMQGYAPIVKQTRRRTHCDDLTDLERDAGMKRRWGCGRPVFAGQRHICIYNAHLHLDTITAAERLQLIADLRELGVKEETLEPLPVDKNSPQLALPLAKSPKRKPPQRLKARTMNGKRTH